MNLRLISCFGWGKKLKRKSVWVCDRSDEGFVFLGGRGGLVIVSDLDEFGVFFGIRKSV